MTARAAIWIAAMLLFAGAAGAARIEPIGPPSLAALVGAGKLPSVAQRLPLHPAVADFTAPWRMMGRHGGALRLVMGRVKDIRMMVVYGYARLVGYDRKGTLRADILERYEVSVGTAAPKVARIPSPMNLSIAPPLSWISGTKRRW